MNYEQAKELLTSQGKFYINLGLKRIQSILKLIGNPQEKIKIIHVAGTNGKGSVSSILANILKCAGYKTGLYTSPHLVEYTERIKINNIDISKE
ncbi:TPA: bifunctional folylpolyglutamate synthase/dihydrofolate synthase, partial [Candidatus Avigastranaerophilus faecigallinarum]|nr:bifunctional folylpolyglutamate synthase/dihydrofolate synthase [Candidatus Avigastranaerophilus faecigallinarum]